MDGFGPYLDLLETWKIEIWVQMRASHSYDHINPEVRDLICPQGGMGAWQGLGKARIGVGILVKIGWWGVPQNVGPRDRSKLKTP